MMDQLPGDISLPSSDEYLKKLRALGAGEGTYSVKDFFRTPEKTGFQLSPDGMYYSYLGPYERRLNIFIQKIGSTDVLRITHETDRDISGYFWANDHRLIYLKDTGGDENFQLFAVDKDGSHRSNLTPFKNVRIEIIDKLPNIKEKIIIGMNLNNKQLFEPFKLNIETGEIEKLAENTDPESPISGWMTDHDGQLRIAFRIENGINHTLLYRSSEEQDFKDILTTDFKQNISPLVFDFEERDMCYVSTNIGRDKSVIVKMDMNTGKEMGTPLFEHPDVDVANLGFSRKRKVLTVISYTTDKRHYHYLDSDRKAIQERLQSELGGYEISIVGFNDDEDKLLVRTHSDRSLGSYYFYDMLLDELIEIAQMSPWLDESQMCKMLPISYTSRDGLLIHGYLTLPLNIPHKTLPIVVNPHGGPWVRDGWGYNPEVQLLANRGYGILQVNYRGSTGYGRDFWEKSFKQWGKSMQDDLTDGVHWLIGQGVADPNRIAIYGGSYGGYATLAGLTFTPEVYACGIDYVGVSNLLTFMQTIPPYWQPYLKMMYEMVGDPELETAAMKSASPAFHVDKIIAPLLVVQGANDPRVNIDEADQIVRSLRSRGIEVPYMVKYDEGHGFRNEENRFEFYEALLGFLKQHL